MSVGESLRESLPGVSTRLSACPSSTVHVTTSTSARASAHRLGRQSLGPWNIGVSRQAGRRAEGHEPQASGGLGVEVDDFALEILSRCDLAGSAGAPAGSISLFGLEQASEVDGDPAGNGLTQTLPMNGAGVG